MTTNEISTAAKRIVDLEALIDELNAECDSLKNVIKGFMENENTEYLEADGFQIRYQKVVSSRIDTTALKKLFSPDDLKGYMKEVTTRRFSIA